MRKETFMLILVAAIPLLIALAGTGMSVESLPADELSRMGAGM